MMGINRKSATEQCAKNETLEHLILSGISLPNSFSQGSGSMWKKILKSVKPEVVDDYKETVPSRYNRIDTHKLKSRQIWRDTWEFLRGNQVLFQEILSHVNLIMGNITMQEVRTLYGSTMDDLKLEKISEGITSLARTDIMLIIIIISLMIISVFIL